MAIRMIHVRHKVTGKKAFLPETALPNFPGYVKTPSQKARDEVPDGSAFPGAPVDDDEPPTLEQPPRGGAGSGEDVWRAYAGQRGIDVSEATSRDEVIALVDAADSDT